MLKTLRLKKEFDLVYQKGRSVYGSFFSLRALGLKDADAPTRYAVVISTKVSKSAVVRNRLRRQIKEIIRLNAGLLQKGFWFLVVISPEAVMADFPRFEAEFLDLARKTKLII